MPPPRTAQALPVVMPVAQALRRLKLFASTGVWLPRLSSASISFTECWEDTSSPRVFSLFRVSVMMENHRYGFDQTRLSCKSYSIEARHGDLYTHIDRFPSLDPPISCYDLTISHDRHTVRCCSIEIGLSGVIVIIEVSLAPTRAVALPCTHIAKGSYAADSYQDKDVLDGA